MSVKIGVLGCANIAVRSVIPALLELPDTFAVVGVASRSVNKANDIATRFGLKAFYSYDEMLTSAGLKAVYIPLPNALHFEWIEKALRLGIHVLVEKSLACSEEQVVYVNSLAKSNNLVLLENFQFRFHSQLMYIKSLISDGVIGELRSVRACFGFPPFSDLNNIRYQKALGGGALLDAGAYPIKLAQLLLQGDISVRGAKWHLDPVSGVDLWGGGFIVEDEGDLFVEFSFGFDHYYQNSVELWGSKGKLSTERIFTAPPDYSPTIRIENKDGKQLLQLPQDNHFKNILNYFASLIREPSNAEAEYIQNCLQAKLIQQFKQANER